MTEPCVRKGCGQEGTWFPLLLLRAPLDYGDMQPVGAFLGVRVCDDHKLTDPKEWITDEGWAQIEAGFCAVFRVLPDRGRVQVMFEKNLPLGFSASAGRITR